MDTLNFSELATLVACNSYSKNKAGVDKHGELMIELLQPLGMSLTRYQRDHIGDHLLFRSPRNEGRKILLLGHLDTVFPPDTFTDFRMDEEWVYGPGVCDMKGGNFVALQALRQLKSQFGQIYNIDFFLVSDEEIGSDDSKHLTAHIAKNYDACFVFEAAGKNHEVVIGRKGIATFEINIEGKAAHAGNHYSDGIDANYAAANLLIELSNLTELSKGSTVNVGKMQGGIGANTISPKASLIVEARFTSDIEQSRLLQSIEDICMALEITGVKITLSGGLQRPTMEPSKAQSALLQELNSILEEPLLTEKRGGVSDANIVAGAGVATLDGFGPYGDGDHTIHERALKSSFTKRIAQMTQILTALCFQDEVQPTA
ncbi:M20 family metallopeptidase [Pseudoalteromonas fenneropenaei]|uniref:M20 family metallopeptidase n=1 Tax=Pseudoalteromonas fenneropenaei TaxID=1737459 RepID=A0ABV7CPV0_9GAMM